MRESEREKITDLQVEVEVRSAPLTRTDPKVREQQVL